MASAVPVLLSDGQVQLEPAADPTEAGAVRWGVRRPPRQAHLGSITLGPDAVPARRMLGIEMPEDASTADTAAMAQAVRLVCQWAFTALNVVVVAWVGPTSPTLRTVVHQAGFRVHPLPWRAGWVDPDHPDHPVDAWYADLASSDSLTPTGPHLTAREQHVLAHMARGRSNDEIAEQLGISRNTVKNHIRSILENLQAPSRTAAVVLAVQTGLVSLEAPAPNHQR